MGSPNNPEIAASPKIPAVWSFNENPNDRGATGADLSAAVAARILHDLSNPLGAVGNGVELLQLSRDASLGTAPGMMPDTAPEITLIADAMRRASQRMCLLRLAFGTAQPGQTVSQREMDEALAALPRLEAGWPAPAGGLERARARLGLLALLCLDSALPAGGVARISDSATGLALAAEGNAPPNLPPQLWEPLIQGGMPATTGPGEVHFTLLAQTTRNLAMQITLAREGAALTLTLLENPPGT
ncbi:histidine phosphotransferase family protein [Alkalilacustris brevis]|uniref:histidine phosphotransferase family protein n=1 Tax=Alkalilacustris brevis TaxID=2026338 RepID=UPI00138FF61F|nr:histidine phosphotransferase family protein [Alkalilacustris brevis]